MTVHRAVDCPVADANKALFWQRSVRIAALMRAGHKSLSGHMKPNSFMRRSCPRDHDPAIRDVKGWHGSATTTEEDYFMSARTLAATAFAAISMAGASPLAAADLDYPEDRHSYTETERYSERVVHQRTDSEEGYYDNRGGCLPRQAIRQRLRDDGWRDIQRVDVRGGNVILTAERSNGQIFDLKVDRCNGEVIDARKSRDAVYGEYRPRGRYYRD